MIVQRDATQSSLFIILQVHRTCFGCQPTILRVTECIIHLSSNIPLYFAVWPVPEAVVTVLCTPAGGCGCHPKHVE